MKNKVGRPRKPDSERMSYVSLAATTTIAKKLYQVSDELGLKSTNATIDFLVNFYEVMK